MDNTVFKAISDPKRRKIIKALTISGAMTITSISMEFSISRQAVTKHLKFLEKANLVRSKKEGRETLCYVQLAPLKEIYDWVIYFEKFWEDKLDSLGNYLESTK